MPKKERLRLIGEFYDAMGTIKNRNEASLIFRDIMDGNEIGNIMRRVDVAVLLLAGFGYDEIVQLLGVGKNKVSSVDRKLTRGGEGYHLLVKRLLEMRKKRKIKDIKRIRKYERNTSFSQLERLKKAYSGHFLLFNLLDAVGDELAVSAESKDDKTEAQEFYKKRSPRSL